MDIKTPALLKYKDKIDAIIGTLKDTNITEANKRSRIIECRKNIMDVTNYLLTAKSKSTDAVFIAEIDAIVNLALSDYKQIAADLIGTADVIPSIEPSKSKSREFLEEMGMIEPTIAEIKPVEVQKSDIMKDISNSYDKCSNAEGSGYYILDKSDGIFLKTEQDLKDFIEKLTMSGVKDIPVIIKGEKITPRIKVNVEFGDTNEEI